MKQKVTVLIGTIIIALLLCACGGEVSPECGEYTLAAARVQGESVSVESVCPEGGALKLLPAGRGRIELGSDDGSVRWLLEGENITVTAGSASYEGSLKDGVMRLSFPDGVELCFVKDGAAAAEDWYLPSDPSPLCGDWYGWWRISNASEDSEFSDSWFDCCARIEALSGGSGRLILWDEDGSAEEPMALVSLRFDGEAASSVKGFFWNGDIEENQWLLDPAAAEFENMLYITGEYADEFEYTICLRPWGTDWGDVEENQPDMLPFFYEVWYKPLMDAAMPDKIN